MTSASDAKDAKEVSECNKYKTHALTKDPLIRQMFAALERGGCGVQGDSIECRKCDNKRIAGGLQSNNKIVLCSNHMQGQWHASSTLLHEAIHAFDQCRAQLDWSNCVHHACSEIRAAALSGDCSFKQEFLRGNVLSIGKQFQRCVRRRAELSVSMNENCDKIAARQAVEKAWDSCYEDTAPFDTTLDKKHTANAHSSQ